MLTDNTLYTLIFLSIFTGSYLTLRSEQGELSIVHATVDSLRHNLLNKIQKANRKKKATILNLNPKNILYQSLRRGLIFGLFSTAILTGKLGKLAFFALPIGIAWGAWNAGKEIERQFQAWQDKLVEGVPGLVEFLPSFLEIKGTTLLEALKNTLMFVKEPLRSEFEHIIDNIERTGRARMELAAFAEKVKEPLVETICYRLISQWDYKPDPSMFDDLKDEIKNAKEEAFARLTLQKKSMLAGLILLGIIGLIFLAGPPVVAFIKSSAMGMTGR